MIVHDDRWGGAHECLLLLHKAIVSWPTLKLIPFVYSRQLRDSKVIPKRFHSDYNAIPKSA